MKRPLTAHVDMSMPDELCRRMRSYGRTSPVSTRPSGPRSTAGTLPKQTVLNRNHWARPVVTPARRGSARSQRRTTRLRPTPERAGRRPLAKTPMHHAKRRAARSGQPPPPELRTAAPEWVTGGIRAAEAGPIPAGEAPQENRRTRARPSARAELLRRTHPTRGGTVAG